MFNPMCAEQSILLFLSKLGLRRIDPRISDLYDNVIREGRIRYGVLGIILHVLYSKDMKHQLVLRRYPYMISHESQYRGFHIDIQEGKVLNEKGYRTVTEFLEECSSEYGTNNSVFNYKWSHIIPK